MNLTVEGKKFSLQSDMMHLVQNSIKERLNDIISKEVENAGEVTPQTWKITAHDVTKIIKESPEMNSLLYDVQSVVTLSVEQFISNIENDPIAELSKNKTFLHKPLNDTWLQDLGGVGPMHYEQIAVNTSQHKPLKIRKQALNAFIQFVPSEVVTNQYWSQIRRNLKENLCEENNEVFALTLKIHAKLLQSVTQFCVREGFVNLIEGLHLYYSNIYHSSLPSFKSGIDLTNVVHDHLSKISHLLLETTKGMPKNWLRYGERRVEEIVGVFVDLLAVHTYSSKLNLPKDILYPFHIISVLDPKANWCKQWVHGIFGSHIFLNTLSQNISFVCYLVNEVISYMEQHEIENLDILHENKISDHILKSAIFSHSLNILNKIVSYEKGRKLFPVNLRATEEPVSIENILVRMITYLNLQNKYDVPQFESELVTNFITNILKTDFEEVSDKFIAVLIEPLQHEYNLRSKYLNIPFHTINILYELTKNSMRIYGLLGGRHKHKLPYSKILRNQSNTNSSATSIRRNKSINMSLNRQYSARLIKIPNRSTADPSSPATIIEHITTMFIRNKDVSQIETLLSLIEICGKLFIIHEGLSMLGASSTHLIPSVVNLYMQLSSENGSFVNGTSFSYSLKFTDYNIQSQSLYRSLEGFLSSVASTPCGLHALAQQDTVLQDLLRTIFRASHIPWENPEFRYMVSLMTSVAEGVPVLSEESHRIFAKCLTNLQCVFEDPIALMTGSDRKQMQTIQYFINIIFSFVPNLQGVMALLNEPEGSNDGTLVDADPIPTSLLELLTYDNTVDCWHYISLLTLRALTTNIDICLQLNTKFEFQERLLKLQAENVTSDNNTDIEDGEDSQTQSNTTNKPIIIDECSRLRHQILVTTYAVGGPTERLIPPAIIEPEQLDDGELHFFSSFSALHFMSTRNMKNTRIKGQTDLQKFLQDTKQGLHDTNWLSHVRRAYKSSRSEDIKAHVLLDLIDQVAKLNLTSTAFLNGSDVESNTLLPEDYLGIKLAIRYGVRCHLLQENSQSEDNLAQLLLIAKRHVKKRSDTTFNGFDWFIATLFLLCGGSVDRCCRSIESMLSLPVTPFIWRTLASAHDHLSQHTFMFGHLLELLIKIELPLAFSALQLAGASWWLICRQWMAQCFWNVLDWSQICHWLVIGILNQPDYMLYFCISLLRHMQPRVLQAVNDGNAWEQIMITSIEGFQVGEQLSYMEKLAKRHRTSVLHHLISVSTSGNLIVS